MKRYFFLFFIVITFYRVGWCAWQKDSHYNYRLLPVPQSIKQENGVCHLSANATIYYPQNNPQLAEYIDSFLNLSRLRLSVKQVKGLANNQIVINKKLSVNFPQINPLLKSRGPQAYELIVRETGIRITANSAKGAFWGLMTLSQLLNKTSNGLYSVSAVTISDWPHYNWRGYMLDTGRAPYSVAQIKRIIRICSAFKLDFLIIREGDDELNAFRFKHLLLGSKNPYALSLDDFAELVAYGKKYALTVFPEIESLGHIQSKKKFYPQLVQGGIVKEYWPGFQHIRKANLDVNNPQTYKLLEAMYDEIFPHISYPMVHIGLDEVQLPKDEQARHLKNLLPIVERVGRKYDKDMDILVWSDAPPTPAAYRGKVIRCLWRYNSEVMLQSEKLERQGLQELLKKDCRERVFMAGGSGTNHKPYSKDPYAGAFINLYSWAKLGENHTNFVGIYAVQWATNTIDRWLPDFLMAADFGWNVPDKKPDYTRYMKKIGDRLKVIEDYIRPQEEDVPRPAWDGIWLNGNYWGEDIMSGEKAAPQLTIEPAGGYFLGKTKPVKVISSLKNAKIFYTTDGTIPSAKSSLYFEPLIFDSTLTLKAIAFAPDRAPSYVKEAIFIDSAFQSAPPITQKLQQGLTYRFYDNYVKATAELDDKKEADSGIIDKIRIGAQVEGKEEFGYIFDGYLSVPARGKYTFYLYSNDGSRLYFNGHEVINNDGRHKAQERSVRLSLEKGIYPIKLKYFQYGGGKALKLFWEGPGIKKCEIEAKYFFTQKIKS